MSEASSHAQSSYTSNHTPQTIRVLLLSEVRSTSLKSVTALFEGHYFFSRLSTRECLVKTDSAATLLRYKIARIRKLCCWPRQGRERSKNARRWCFLISKRICCLGAGFTEKQQQCLRSEQHSLDQARLCSSSYLKRRTTLTDVLFLEQSLLQPVSWQVKQIPNLCKSKKRETEIFLAPWGIAEDWLYEPTQHAFLSSASLVACTKTLFLLHAFHGFLLILSKRLTTGNESCFITKAYIDVYYYLSFIMLHLIPFIDSKSTKSKTVSTTRSTWKSWITCLETYLAGWLLQFPLESTYNGSTENRTEPWAQHSISSKSKQYSLEYQED